MKIYLLLIVLVLWISVGSGFTQSRSSKSVVVKAEVVKIGAVPKTVSGARRLSFQLVKYRVIETSHKVKGSEFIVVDHVIFSLDQLAKLRVGDLVTLRLSERGTLSPIIYESGIRDEGQIVTKFYIPSSSKLEIKR